MPTANSASDMKTFLFRQFGADRSYVYGALTIPVKIQNVVQFPVGNEQRGLSISESEASRSVGRRAGLEAGRKRLASISSKLNSGRESLADLRLAVGLTQAALAERLGMLQPNVARQERHPGDLTLSRVQALAQVLECDLTRVVSAIAVSNGDSPISEVISTSLMHAFWQADVARNQPSVQLSTSQISSTPTNQEVA